MVEEIGYCDLISVKDRILIETSDTSYNSALEIAICEASRLVDIFLKPYLVDPEPPLAEENVNAQLSAITADFAASIFKRRMMPEDVKMRGALQPDMINEIDSSGWFAQGLKKIEQYIKSYYTLAEAVGNIAHNPDIYLTLFKQGIITGKEARAFINTESSIALNKIDTITKIETLTKVDNITSTLVEGITRTLGETLTKQQTDQISQVLSKTLIDVLTVTKNITSIEDLTKSLVDTLVEDITRELKETIAKTLIEDITRTVGETLTKNQSDIESLVRSEGITITKTLTEVDTIDKTLTTDETHTQYITKKQKTFSFIKSDGSDGYADDTVS